MVAVFAFFRQLIALLIILVCKPVALLFSFVCHIIAVHLSLFSQTIILQNEQEIITHTAIER